MAEGAVSPVGWILEKVYVVFGHPRAKKEKALQAIDSDTRGEISAFCEKPDISFLCFQAPGEAQLTASSDLLETR